MQFITKSCCEAKFTTMYQIKNKKLLIVDTVSDIQYPKV